MKKFILLLMLAGAGYAAWRYRPEPPPVPGAGGRGAPGAKPGELPPVPVVETKVLKKDVPIYLNGLGNVQGFNTVTVRSRVDGQIDKVAFTEGQEVHKGDLLVKIDPKPFKASLDQAIARKAQDEALLANAKLDLDRNTKLLAEKAVPEQKVDTQKALVAQLEATVHADQAAVDSAQVQLSYTTILSPIDGRAGLRLVDEGNVVRSSDLTGLVVISQLKPIVVIFTLPEKHLPVIQSEMGKAKMKVIALGRDNNVELGEGELLVVDNQIDMTTGTIKLKAAFPNDNTTLWPGQFINARLLVTTRKDGLTVPASVIQHGPDSTYAFVIKEDQSAEMRTVEVEQYEDGLALIKSGLQAGERVVVDGQFRLQRGSKVKTGDGKPGAGGKPGGGPPGKGGPPGEKPAGSPATDKPHGPETGKPKADS